MSGIQLSPNSLEPLPCPFCGSRAEWSHHSTSYAFDWPDQIQCVTKWQCSLHCTGCRLPHCSGFGEVKYEHGNALAQQYAMKRALQQWNRREGLAKVLNILHLKAST